MHKEAVIYHQMAYINWYWSDLNTSKKTKAIDHCNVFCKSNGYISNAQSILRRMLLKIKTLLASCQKSNWTFPFTKWFRNVWVPFFKSYEKYWLMVVNHANPMQKSCGILHWWMNCSTSNISGGSDMRLGKFASLIAINFLWLSQWQSFAFAEHNKNHLEEKVIKAFEFSI